MMTGSRLRSYEEGSPSTGCGKVPQIASCSCDPGKTGLGWLGLCGPGRSGHGCERRLGCFTGSKESKVDHLL